MKVPKDLDAFNASLKSTQPPNTWKTELRALWWEAKGDWNSAHELVDRSTTPEATWIHAYLHRKEGDMWNADYWYGRAGRSRPTFSLEEEFKVILSELLGL